MLSPTLGVCKNKRKTYVTHRRLERIATDLSDLIEVYIAKRHHLYGCWRLVHDLAGCSADYFS